MNQTNHIKVQGHSSLVRNAETKAIINTDSTSYISYMKRANKNKQESESLENAIHDIDDLKSDMLEIKTLLQQLLGRNLEFEMRRRQDAEFIFVVASPSMGRQIKPFINYYYAYDLPVIATSRIYSGKRA